MESPYTKAKWRARAQGLFRFKLVRSWFTRFIYYTQKPWFFGPFAQPLTESVNTYLANHHMETPQASVSINGHAHLLYSATPGVPDFSTQRVALMGHWDPHGIIDEYVRYYAQHLRDLGFAVVLASSGKLVLTEEDTRLFSAIVYRTCPGYDFTSHKAAFAVLPSLYNSRELLITNDSMFAPLGSFEPVFSAMRTVPCDFWGLIEKDGDPRPFLHSYFLVFKPKVLTSPLLHSFIDALELRDDKAYACDCEERLTCLLAQGGLTPAAFLPAHSLPYPGFGLLRRAWRVLLPLHIPFAKRFLFTDKGVGSYTYKNWKETFASYGYPVELVTNYFKRCRISIK